MMNNRLPNSTLELLKEKMKEPTLRNIDIMKICGVCKNTVQKYRKEWNLPLPERKPKLKTAPVKYKTKDGYGDSYLKGEPHPVVCKCPYYGEEYTLLLKGNYFIKPRFYCETHRRFKEVEDDPTSSRFDF